jgi:hypothetical protein
MKKKPSPAPAAFSKNPIRPDLSEFWVLGWLACVAALGTALIALLGLEGESAEWGLYLSLGLFFPTGIWLIGRHLPAGSRTGSDSLRTLLGSVAGLAALALTVYLISPWALLGALVQLTAERWIWKEDQSWPAPWRAGFALLFWSIAWKALFWKSPGEWLGSSLWTPVCALAFAVAAPALFLVRKPLPTGIRKNLSHGFS